MNDQHHSNSFLLITTTKSPPNQPKIDYTHAVLHVIYSFMLFSPGSQEQLTHSHSSLHCFVREGFL